MALGRHRSTTFRLVVVALVLREVERFFASLKRKACGCLEVGDGVALDQARKFALELFAGRVDGPVRALCQGSRCVRPDHLEVAP